MIIDKVLRVGYFDNLILDGYNMNFFGSEGIKLCNECTLNESLLKSNNKYTNGLSKLRINLIGEAENNKEHLSAVENPKSIREDELKLTPIKMRDKTRYVIAYMEILVIDSTKISDDYSYMSKDIKSVDTVELLNCAIDRIERKIQNIGILSKIYIDKNFRELGIFKWMLDNIFDIIKQFSDVLVDCILLIPGDFSNESEQLGISLKEYNKNLASMYKKHGYKNITGDIYCKKRLGSATTIINITKHIGSKNSKVL